MRPKGHAGEHRDTVRVTLALTCVHTVILFIGCFFSLTLTSSWNFPHKLCISIKLNMESNTNAKNSTKAKG